MKTGKKKAGSTTTEKKSRKRQRREILLLLTDTEISAIVKIESTYQDTHPDNPFGVTVFCKALDSFGLIYELELKFSSETLKRKGKILADLKKDSIHLVKGRYNVFKKTFSISILDPEYMPLPSDIEEEGVREGFRVNGKSL
jgi:hypothetical protein